MAKTTIKKNAKTNNSKAPVKKSPVKKETKKGNTKIKLATPKKSVTKKLIASNDASKKKSPKPSLKLTKSELPEVVVPQEPNYDECIFTVVSPELGFIKLEEGDIPYAVKLLAGVTITKKDSMHYEFKGKDHNGNDIGTIFDCIDKEESDQFMKELIDFTKNGAVTFAPINKSEETKDVIQPPTDSIQPESNSEPNISTSEVNAEPKSLDEFNGMPIQAEDMNSIIESMKNKGITAPPIPNLAQKNQPAVLNQNGNINNPTNYKAKKTTSIHTLNDEEKLNEISKYGKSIKESIDGTFQARIQGGLPMSDFMATINKCSKNYTYDVKNDGNGYYLIISFEELQVRVPENENEFLKVK